MVTGLLPLIVEDHAVEGGLHIARPITAEEDLYVFQRVAGLGNADGLADYLVEIHELPASQQIVQLGFSCPVDHGETL
jgi:hypothetical protein